MNLFKERVEDIVRVRVDAALEPYVAALKQLSRLSRQGAISLPLNKARTRAPKRSKLSGVTKPQASREATPPSEKVARGRKPRAAARPVPVVKEVKAVPPVIRRRAAQTPSSASETEPGTFEKMLQEAQRLSATR